MRLPTLLLSAALACGPVLAQTGAPSSPEDLKAQCMAAGERSGLTGAALETYVKQCVSRGGPNK